MTKKEQSTGQSTLQYKTQETKPKMFWNVEIKSWQTDITLQNEKQKAGHEQYTVA